MIDWMLHIDSYCERTDASFFSEPLNFISNLAFILAAWSIQKQIRRFGLKVRWDIRLQVLLVYAIGIGSALFHSFATMWAMIADVLPISFFVLYYLWYWLARCLRLAPRKLILLVTLLGLVTTWASLTLATAPLGGSQSYLGVAVFLLGVGLDQKRRQYNPPYLLWAAWGFFASLTFRSIDPYICDYLPIGTHFLWHITNAAVLYVCLLNSLYGEHIRKARGLS
jgi:hypothetical protein